MKRYYPFIVLFCLLIVQASFGQVNTPVKPKPNTIANPPAKVTVKTQPAAPVNNQPNIPANNEAGKQKSFATPGTYTFTVPKGVTALTVSLYGPGGWGGGVAGNMQGKGGNGGFVSGMMPVTEDQVLTIIVGAGGMPGKSGGITAIRKGDEYLAIAAAGGNGSIHGGRGGDGGPSGGGGSVARGEFHSGNSGMGASATAGGTGGRIGSQSSDASGSNGRSLTGGTNVAKATGEGWGGAGWFGGGASATYGSTFLRDDPYASGGGGGGSNYTKGLVDNHTSNSNGSIGGTGSNMGIGGRVDISWR